MTPIEQIKATRGMMARIARGLKIYPASISKWQRVPAERVIEVERITGIPREKLRPDLYRRKR